MTHLVTPEWTVEFGGKKHILDCSFRTLKAIQHEFKKDILDVLTDISAMRFDEHAKMIELGINGTGQVAPSLEEIEQGIIDDIGISEVRWELQAWLVMAVTPKRDREKKAKEVAELLAKVKGSVDSLGKTISNSVSAD